MKTPIHGILLLVAITFSAHAATAGDKSIIILSPRLQSQIKEFSEKIKTDEHAQSPKDQKRNEKLANSLDRAQRNTAIFQRFKSLNDQGIIKCLDCIYEKSDNEHNNLYALSSVIRDRLKTNIGENAKFDDALKKPELLKQLRDELIAKGEKIHSGDQAVQPQHTSSAIDLIENLVSENVLPKELGASHIRTLTSKKNRVAAKPPVLLPAKSSTQTR